MLCKCRVLVPDCLDQRAEPEVQAIGLNTLNTRQVPSAGRGGPNSERRCPRQRARRSTHQAARFEVPLQKLSLIVRF
jgi:hypothetical protein